MSSQKEFGGGCGIPLISPGMEEEVKVTFRISRKGVLLLSQLIGRGLNDEVLKRVFPSSALEALRNLETDLLDQSKFSAEFIEGWKELTTSKAVG